MSGWSEPRVLFLGADALVAQQFLQLLEGLILGVDGALLAGRRVVLVGFREGAAAAESAADHRTGERRNGGDDGDDRPLRYGIEYAFNASTQIARTGTQLPGRFGRLGQNRFLFKPFRRFRRGRR